MKHGQKTENFFSTHVRLITFLITLSVFLFGFLLLEIPNIKERWGQYADMRDPMTIQRLVVLSEQESGISERQIKEYKSKVDEGEYEIYYYFDIEPHYEVIAVVDKNTRLVIYCTLLNESNGDKVDVLTEDLRAYLEAQQQS